MTRAAGFSIELSMEKYRIFIICPLGFEELAISEFKEKLGHLYLGEIFLLKGGFEIEDSLEIIPSLNHLLKIPSRILLRLKEQKCRDLPKLYQILVKFPWRNYFQQNNFLIKAQSTKSRLIHTKKIEETAREAIEEHLKNHKLAGFHLNQTKPDQNIYLRFDDDTLTISLDTTGEHLHKRGETSHRGHAAIRENFAAGLVKFLMPEKFEDCLFDPMCGSATLLREYLNFYTKAQREFNYQYWKNAPKKIEEINETRKLTAFGNDRDQSVIAGIKGIKNLTLSNYDMNEFDSFPAPNLILNPPYGKRIKIQGHKKSFFKDLVEKLLSRNIDRLGIIIPHPYASQFNPSRFIDFNQNGIKVRFLVFENL